MGNASWGPKRRPPPPLLPPDPTPEAHAQLIAQAQLDRLTHPSSRYGVEVVRWTRQLQAQPDDLLAAMVAQLTPQVAELMGQVRNPPRWFTLANWQAASTALDEKQAQLDAATRILGRRG